MATAQESTSDFSPEDDLPKFLNSVLDRIEITVNEERVDGDSLQLCICTLDQTIGLIRKLHDTASDPSDEKQWAAMSDAFCDVLTCLQNHLVCMERKTTYISCIKSATAHNGFPGRPSFDIPVEMLENLLVLGFSTQKIAAMLGVSRWTIYRRMREFDLQQLVKFSPISNKDLDDIVRDYIDRHGSTVGQTYISGYLRSLGLRVQRHRIRECMTRVDPVNTSLRWGIVVCRRKYFVPWPNSLWHLDGHHSLIRWGFVVHGCIDGFSRRIIFLKVATNNLAATVLHYFIEAIESDGGLWPSRVRVDRGVENVLVCDAMNEARGENRGSFIAGPSTRNQRIERLWRDVFRGVLHLYYYIFYGMEDSGLLNLNNPIHMFALQLVFLPRISYNLHEYWKAFNNHSIRTEKNWTPNQMWMNGMMDENNPLANGILDDDPDSLEWYGDDPNGPSPFDDTDNNVVVNPVLIENGSNITTRVLERIDPLKSSSQMGVDIFTEALSLINQMTAEPSQ